MKPDSYETSVFKVDSFNPKCNQQGCMKPDSDETSVFKVDSFNPKCNQLGWHETRNFRNRAGCIWNWTSKLFETAGFMQLQPSWLHLELNESIFA